MLRTRTRCFLLAAGASVVPATPVMADQPTEAGLVPFSATYSGTYQAQVVPPHVIITDTGGKGQATHLGTFELTNRILVNLARGPVEGCPVPGTTEVFTATLTGADGDDIVLEGTGHGCQTSPTTVSVVDTVEVTGGTGRFEGATGSITVRTAVNQAARSEVIDFEGVISRPERVCS